MLRLNGRGVLANRSGRFQGVHVVWHIVILAIVCSGSTGIDAGLTFQGVQGYQACVENAGYIEQGSDEPIMFNDILHHFACSELFDLVHLRRYGVPVASFRCYRLDAGSLHRELLSPRSHLLPTVRFDLDLDLILEVRDEGR